MWIFHLLFLLFHLLLLLLFFTYYFLLAHTGTVQGLGKKRGDGKCGVQGGSSGPFPPAGALHGRVSSTTSPSPPLTVRTPAGLVRAKSHTFHCSHPFSGPVNTPCLPQPSSLPGAEIGAWKASLCPNTVLRTSCRRSDTDCWTRL